VRLGAARVRLVLPRPTAWRLFVLLLVFALGTEYWDKDPLPLGGLQLPWPRFILALAVIPLVIHPQDWRWTALLRVPSPLAPMMVFWICCGLSAVSLAFAPGHADPVEFLKTFIHLTTYVVFVYVVVRWMTWPRLFLLVRVYYLLGIAAAFLAVLQYLHGGFGLFGWLAPLMFQSAEYEVGEGLTTGFRAASIFGEPSWAARYYVHFMALALGYWWETRDRRHLAALALFLLAFYTANSLLGYVILCTFAIVMAIAQMWRRNMFSMSQRKKVALGAVAYALVLAWLAGANPRIPDLLDRSIARVGLVLQGGGGAGNRIDSVFAGLEVWKMAPILGVGLGNIDSYIVDFYNDPAWVLRSRFGSDSLYVQLLAEAGIAGLLAFLWFWGRLLWFSVPPGFARGAGHDVGLAYAWLRFLQMDLFAQAVGMLNSADYLNPHLWTVVAIVLACKTLILRETLVPVSHGHPIAGRRQ
jgi:O-Antigen ligase